MSKSICKQHLALPGILICLFSLMPLAANAEPPAIVTSQQLGDIREKHAVTFEQPNGPFAAMLFNESAQGSHIGVIYYRQMGIPADQSWWISKRFWQENPWNADVTSFAWDKSGKHLYVGTSEVYGDGGLFRLDLYKKAFVKIWPEDESEPVLFTEIISLDEEAGTLKIKLMMVDETTRVIEIPAE